MRSSRQRVLRVLARFDVATTADVADALGVALPRQRTAVWQNLQRCVADGCATKESDGAKAVARYRITDAGRAQLAQSRAAA